MTIKQKEYLWLEIEGQDAWFSSSHLVQQLKRCWQLKVGDHFHVLTLPAGGNQLESIIKSKDITTLVIADPRVNLYPVISKLRTYDQLELYLHVIGSPLRKVDDLKHMKAEGLKVSLLAGSEANTQILKNLVQANIYYFPFLPAEMTTQRTEALENRFLYAGRIAYQKNLVPLLDLFARYQKDINPAAELSICGPACNTHFPTTPHGHYIGMAGERFFKKLSELQKNGHKINYHGLLTREEVEKISLSHRTFVSLSTAEEEDFGMGLYESLSRGLNAVVTNWGGHREFGALTAVELVTVSHRNKTLMLDQEQFFQALQKKPKSTAADLSSWRKNRMKIIEELAFEQTADSLKINLKQPYVGEEFFNEHQQLVSPYWI